MTAIDKDSTGKLTNAYEEDSAYKKKKVSEMIFYVEKKLTKRAPKYFNDDEGFPMKSDDFPKYNCISVGIEFLKNCNKFGFSLRLVSLITNLFEKARGELKNCNYSKELKLKYLKVFVIDEEHALVDTKSRASSEIISLSSIHSKQSPTEIPKINKTVVVEDKQDGLRNSIQRFLKDNYKTSDLDAYKQFFESQKNELIDNFTVAEILKIFLDNYIDCHYTVALVRANLVVFLIETFAEGNVFKDGAFCCNEIFNEFLMKCLEEGY